MSITDIKIIRRSGQHTISFSPDTHFGSNDKKVFEINSSSEGKYVNGTEFEFYFVILFSATEAAISVKEAYGRKMIGKTDPKQLAAWATIPMTNCDILTCDLDSDGNFTISLEVKPGMVFGRIEWNSFPTGCSSLKRDMIFSQMERFGIDKIRYIRLVFRNPTSNRFLNISQIKTNLWAHQHQKDIKAIDAQIQGWHPEKAISFELFARQITNTTIEGAELVLEALKGGLTLGEVEMMIQQYHLRKLIYNE